MIGTRGLRLRMFDCSCSRALVNWAVVNGTSTMKSVYCDFMRYSRAPSVGEFLHSMCLFVTGLEMLCAVRRGG